MSQEIARRSGPSQGMTERGAPACRNRLRPATLHSRCTVHARAPMEHPVRRQVMSSAILTLAAMGFALCSAERAALAQGQVSSREPVPHGQDRLPNAPRPVAEAIKAMTVPPGFQVEVVASEPDIMNPVAMTFDERGRVWITESLEYPRHAPGPGRDRVKVLEDTDGDGKADRFTVFADGLNIPSGIAVGHGGVWVANSPDILFLQDTRWRRQGRFSRGGRVGLRPRRYSRVAQFAHLGAGRLALWLERRIQPEQGDFPERQDLPIHVCDLPHSSQDAATSRSCAKARATPGESRSTPRARSSPAPA